MCNDNGVRDCRELLKERAFLVGKVCESTFSMMKQVKPKNRNRMAFYEIKKPQAFYVGRSVARWPFLRPNFRNLALFQVDLPKNFVSIF